MAPTDSELVMTTQMDRTMMAVLCVGCVVAIGASLAAPMAAFPALAAAVAALGGLVWSLNAKLEAVLYRRTKSRNQQASQILLGHAEKGEELARRIREE